jgi:hypothetical protein
MTTPRLLAALAAGLVLAGAPWALAEEKTEGKAKDKPKARTYTDEDLKKYKAPPDASSPQSASPASTQAPASSGRPRRSREDGTSEERPEPSSSEPAGPSSEAAPDTGSPSSEPAAPERSPEETQWRSRAAQARRPLDHARSRVAGIDAEIAELRDKLNPMSTNYVLGGTSTAGPGQVLEIQEKLRSLDEEKVQAQAELAEAQEAWERFVAEARGAGAAPGWLTP